MTRKKKTAVTYIYFEQPTKKIYIAAIPVRPDNVIIPIMTEDKEEAHWFEDNDHVKSVLDRLSPAFAKHYQTISATVEQETKTPYIRGGWKQENEQV